jgi:hypothetical protein
MHFGAEETGRELDRPSGVCVVLLFRLFGACFQSIFPPRACALGCILAPLRGCTWDFGDATGRRSFAPWTAQGGCPHVCALNPTSLSMTGFICRAKKLFGEEVVEGFHGGEFVVFYVEDGVELGDVEDVLNFLGEAEEFEFAACVADGGEA